MQDLRKKLLLIIGSAIGVILLLIFLVIYFSRDTTPDQTTGPTTTVPTGNTQQPNQNIDQGVIDPLPEPVVAPITTVAPEVTPEVQAKQIARLFTERFLSYSNQNNNQHIDDVAQLATNSMQDWLNTKRIAPNTDSYFGYTTKVISSAVTQISNSNASVLLGVQQQVTENGSTKTLQKNIRIDLNRSGETWLVNRFTEE